MKTLGYYLCLFLIGIVLFSCKKNDDDPKFRNIGVVNYLNDTIIKPSIDHPATNTATFALDIDNDQVADIVFKVVSHSLGREAYTLSYVELFNGYSIAVQQAYEYNRLQITTLDSISTSSVLVDIPKLFSTNDIISKDLNFASDSIVLAYYYNNAYAQYKWRKDIPHWVSAGDRYLGFYNEQEGILGWIKINVPAYDQIILKSYYYMTDSDFLRIEDH